MSLAEINALIDSVLPERLEAIALTRTQLHGLMREDMPHLNDFEINALSERVATLFGVRLIIDNDQQQPV